MDNRLTKKRLGNFLSYEWVLMLFVIALSVVVWILIFRIAAVKLKENQTFTFYTDETVNEAAVDKVYDWLDKEGVLLYDYDILETVGEPLVSRGNVLFIRLSTGEGDVIFTDCKPDENGVSRADEYVEQNYMVSFDDLYKNGGEYLLGFMEDGTTDWKTGNFDEIKYAAAFRERMKGDNRYKTDEEIIKGISKEKSRLTRLREELIFFGKVLALDEGTGDVFFWHDNGNGVKERYGFKTENLDENKTGSVFRMKDADDNKYVTLMVFNFCQIKPDSQYDSVTFINALIRDFSDLTVE